MTPDANVPEPTALAIWGGLAASIAAARLMTTRGRGRGFQKSSNVTR
jgi:hypothetical protein